MNNLLREVFGIFNNLPERTNNELVPYRNTDNSLVRNSEINNYFESSDRDNITPFEEAFPNLMKDIYDSKILESLNNEKSEDLFQKYFGDIDLDKLVQNPSFILDSRNNYQDIKELIFEGQKVVNIIRTENEVINESPLLKKYLELREMKVGEIIDNIFDHCNIDVEFLNNISEFSPLAFKLMGMGLLYRSVVKLFSVSAFKELPKNDPLKNTAYRANLLKAFMLYGGIPITGALFIMSNVYSNHLIYEKIKKAIDPSLN